MQTIFCAEFSGKSFQCLLIRHMRSPSHKSAAADRTAEFLLPCNTYTPEFPQRILQNVKTTSAGFYALADVVFLFAYLPFSAFLAALAFALAS